MGKNDKDLLRCELCFLSPWLPFDHSNLHNLKSKGINLNNIPLQKTGIKNTKHVVLCTSKYESGHGLQDKKIPAEQKRAEICVARKCKNFDGPLTTYCLGNVISEPLSKSKNMLINATAQMFYGVGHMNIFNASCCTFKNHIQCLAQYLVI